MFCRHPAKPQAADRGGPVGAAAVAATTFLLVEAFFRLAMALATTTTVDRQPDRSRPGGSCSGRSSCFPWRA